MATKLVRKPTTTKTSVGKETVNQTVARAKAMLGSAYDPNTKAPSASRMKEISEQSFIKPEVKKAYDKSVSAMALANTDSPVLPSPVVAQKPGFDMGVINAGLGQTDTTGMFQIPEMTVSETAGAGEQAAVSSVNALGQQIQGYLGINKPEEGASEKALAKAREQAGVQQAQQEFNRYQNQINAITSQRDAQILSLEGQGRGQTTQFLGGEQARISREAAITALPIQAQLAAAQGNLEQAKELMGQLYQAKSADIQADMAYRTNLVNSLISFASSSQQTVLQAKLADNAQKAQAAQANLAYQRQLSERAFEYGQGNLVTNISSIDPKSPTFEQDLARVASKLKDPMLALQQEQARASIANTYDQIRARQDALNQAGVEAVTANEKAQVEQVKASEKALEIRKALTDLQAMPGKSAAVGAGFKKTLGNSIWGISPDAVAGTARADFEASANRVKNLLTLDNLKLMSGVLSETDIKILETAGSNLANFSQSEESYNKEIQRVIDSMNRTVSNNGITEEQATFWGVLAPEDIQTFNSLWETL